jgi:hypothetical protein
MKNREYAEYRGDTADSVFPDQVFRARLER